MFGTLQKWVGVYHKEDERKVKVKVS